MNRENNKLLFALVRSAIRGDELEDIEKALVSDETIRKISAVAKHHDIAHLATLALKKNGIAGELTEKTENIILKAAYRHRQLNYEYALLCDVLEAAKIPFIPLKGSVMRKYYPEPWMRTSCDIDILVNEDDTEKVKDILTREYEYTYETKNSHDLSLFSPNNIHVELHYNLVGDGIAKESSEILKSVWNSAIHRDGLEFCFDMPDEMFYFYHIAHMAKHFENGGCGIRPFIDLWLLDHIEGISTDKRDKLLEKGKLLRFANVARKLSNVWFENDEHDDISTQMENYIIRGGVYGNNENRITIQQQKKGGKFKYALSRIFIPYDELKFHYPVIQKHKWLTPFMEIRRWFKLAFCGGAKRSINELKYNSSITQDKAAETKQFLKDIGL